MNSLDKILEQFGIYDLVAVLLSGISMSTFSLLVLQFIYNIKINSLQVNKALAFLVISYFLGIIFQEFGSVLTKKVIYRNNLLLKKALEITIDTYTLTQTEKNGIFNYVKNQLGIENDNEKIIYNYCKFYVMKNCNTTKIDRDQSLSALSRSLSLYFLISSIIALITIIIAPTFMHFCFLIISIIFFITLFYRCVRFAKLRYTNIFRTFYYVAIANNHQ